MSFTINMEQMGDTIERVLQDVEDKKVRKNRSFSDAGMAEIVHLHEVLLTNLRLAMSVFLGGHVRDAQRLLEEKARFRDLEHEYAASHLARLRGNTAQSIETSSLHIDLISDLKRINSLICSSRTPSWSRTGRCRRRASGRRSSPTWSTSHDRRRQADGSLPRVRDAGEHADAEQDHGADGHVEAGHAGGHEAQAAPAMKMTKPVGTRRADMSLSWSLSNAIASSPSAEGRGGGQAGHVV